MKAGRCAIAAVLAAVGGCGETGGGGSNVNISGTEITDPTLAAVDAASDAIQSLVQASVVAQSPVDVRAQEVATGFEFGTCPVVQGAAGEVGAPVNINVGFGGSCPVIADYVCSGEAMGQLNPTTGRLGMDFNGVTCSSRILTGNVDLGVTALPAGADMTGQWNLTSAVGSEQTMVLGTGESLYDRNLTLAHLVSFTGQITEPPQQYTMTLDNVQVTILNNPALAPAIGTATLTGGPDGPITITFNADSPLTGNVQVSTAGGPVQTVNLFSLPQPVEGAP